ncbi:hypothetical protein FBU30_009456 [Linnemannia zychae]|nr:hypothetical protein FBU30_009456 [Linnemannia zychae]
MSLPPSSEISSPNNTPTVPVLDENDPVVSVLNDESTVRALIEATVAYQQQQEAAAAAAAAAVANAAASGVQMDTIKTVADAASPMTQSVPADIIQQLIPSATNSPALSAPVSPAPVVTHTALSPVPPPPQATATAPVSTKSSITTATSSSTSTSTSSSSSSSTSRPFVSTKRFNPDDIFCLGCCRNLSVEHYTCPNTNRIFKSCNACRLKSRVNSKKVVKPPTIPNRPTISMEEFGEKLKELENTPDKSSNLDVMIRLGGSVEMDPETLKARGAMIAAQVYESTGYWFSHSRTNDETQAKTRLKIYGCSQREDRRAPPAPKTQSRKRNRPSTKAYFPCKGNLTMTFYQNVDHVRVVYNHKKHEKYDNRKCPDYVRVYVKENLSLAPRTLYDNLMEQHPNLGITQAQVRYWSHYYKKSMDQEGGLDSSRGGSNGPSSPLTHPFAIKDSTIEQVMKDVASSQQQLTQQHQATVQDHLDSDSVQQLLMASNAVALQTQGLVGGPIAISVPMSDMPLSSSIVQRVLAEDGGKELLELQARLSSVAAIAASVQSSGVDNSDEVVQQVSALLKENDQQLLKQQQEQQQEQQQQEQQQLQEQVQQQTSFQ